ncbi:MAG: hypothetical protein NC416_08035, partial [Eubacterium sp.]|nr:hypothetical protein [Eubacterium sp.]
VEAGYMTLGDWIDSIIDDVKEDMAEEIRREVTEEVTRKVTEEVTKKVTEEATKKVKEEEIRIMIELCQEYHDTKENAIDKIRMKFPEYGRQAGELVERYWKEQGLSS